MKEIALVHGKGTALVDDEDYLRLNRYRWYYSVVKSSHTFYITTSIKLSEKHSNVQMPRLILSLTDLSYEVDHIDGNGFNNQRKNLRIVPHSINMQNRPKSRNNTSGYIGVSWQQSRLKFIAYISLNSKKITLGRFPSAVEAALAYDTAKRLYHPTCPENQRTFNFPMEELNPS